MGDTILTILDLSGKESKKELEKKLKTIIEELKDSSLQEYLVADFRKMEDEDEIGLKEKFVQGIRK